MNTHTENYLKRFLILLVTNTRLIYAITGIFLITAVCIFFLAPPTYKTAGSILVKSKKLDTPPEAAFPDSAANRIMPPTREDLLTEIQLITSESNIKEALTPLLAQNMALSQAPSVLGRIKENLKSVLNAVSRPIRNLFQTTEDNTPPPTEVELMAKRISGSLNASIIPGSNVINVDLTHRDPEIGQTILNAILNSYLDFRIRKYTNQSASRFFEDKTAAYENALTSLHRKKLDILHQHRLNDLDQEITIQMNRIGRMLENIDTLEETIQNEKEKLHSIENAYTDYLNQPYGFLFPFPYNFEDQGLSEIKGLHINLLQEHSALKKAYKPKSQKIKEMEKQLKDVWEKLVFLVKAKIDIQKENLAMLLDRRHLSQEKLAGLRAENETLTTLKMEIERINHQIELTRQNYDMFYQRIESSNIKHASVISQLSNVQILQSASAPLSPMFPKTATVIPAAFLTGLLLAVALAFIRDFFDHTIKVPENVHEHLDLPVIGSIPVLFKS